MVPKDRQLLAIMLACLAVICLFLAYGLRAARSHYATTEQVMADYAAMAAENLAARIKSRIGYGAGHQVLRALAGTRGSWDERLGQLRVASTLAKPVREAIAGIALMSEDGGASRCVAGACGPVLAAALPIGPPGFRFGHHHRDPAGAQLYVSGVAGTDTVIVHFAPAAIATLLAEVLAAGPILPGVLSERMGGETLAVAVRDGPVTIFEAGGDSTRMRSATRLLDDDYGRLLEGAAVTVGIAAAAADALIIGGLPADRVLLMLLLALVTLIVTGLLLRLIWRERQLVRTREGFVARVSHELRTPLAQIRLFCETLLLGREPDPAQQHRYLAIIDREARRLGQLVDNVLRFSDRSSATPRIVIETVALAPLLEELAEAQAPLAAARDMRIDVQAPADLCALGDRDALRQVLLNLVDNATRHGADGQRVTLSACADDSSARIRVCDEGPGIAPKDRERVWTAFERQAEAGTGGVGLGLAVARELVEAMAGECGIDDASGGGTCVWVRLPRAESG